MTEYQRRRVRFIETYQDWTELNENSLCAARQQTWDAYVIAREAWCGLGLTLNQVVTGHHLARA